MGMNFGMRLSLLCVVYIFFSCRVSECIKRTTCVFDGRSLGCDQRLTRQIYFFKTPYNTFITLLQDIYGKKFIVKQDFKEKTRWQWSSAYDKLGAFIAESIGVYANRVEIIPAQCQFLGKHITSLPATLHTYVPGIQIDKLPSPLKAFEVELRQAIDSRIPEERWGLNRRIIQSMTKHKDLPALVALDTFIANRDRNKKNCFYDIDSDHYFAIDFADCFKNNVALYACTFIQSMVNDPYEKTSIDEMRVLKMYRDVLKRLIKLYTPFTLYEKLIEFARDGRIIPRKFRTIALVKLGLCKEVMEENYKSCKRLVVLLDELIMKHR